MRCAAYIFLWTALRFLHTSDEIGINTARPNVTISSLSVTKLYTLSDYNNLSDKTRHNHGIYTRMRRLRPGGPTTARGSPVRLM